MIIQGLDSFRQTQTLSRQNLDKHNSDLINAWLHFIKIINFFWKRSLINPFLNLKPNSTLALAINFLILTSNTITDKYTLVKDLCVNLFYRVFFSPPGFLSQPWQNLYIYIHVLKVFNSQLLEINKYMNETFSKFFNS